LSKAGQSNGRFREGRSDWRFILVAEQNAAFRGTITLVNDLAVWSNPQEWKSTTFSDTTGERARLACWFWRQNELPMI